MPSDTNQNTKFSVGLTPNGSSKAYIKWNGLVQVAILIFHKRLIRPTYKVS